MLLIISQCIQAGNSVEGAFGQAVKELEKVYRKNSVILTGIQKIVNGIEMNIPIEKLVAQMASTINEEEVELFASVFTGAKRSGADMVEVISFTIDSLLEKIKIKREIDLIIRSKKTEQNIMNVVPMAILLYIKLCSGGFLESLYHNISGILIMTGFLLIYMIAYIWSLKIMQIEV